MQNLTEIGSPILGGKIGEVLDFTARPREALCRYCNTQGPTFRVFAPQGRHVAPIKVKSGRFHLDRLRNVGFGPKL